MKSIRVILVWLFLLIVVGEASNGAFSLFYERYLTPIEKALEVPTWYYLVLAGIDLVLFFAAAVFLGYLMKRPYSALLAAIALAQAHILIELIIGGIWRFHTSHPSAFEFIVTWSPFFVPTIGTVAGAVAAKSIWSEKSAANIA